jgi:SAM-dependent methyltransferase
MSDAAHRWDPRWRRRGTERGAPTPLLQEWGARLPKGAAVLELGAGNGRDTLPLAALGLAVTAVDASPVGLAALSRAAAAAGLAVETVCAELRCADPSGEDPCAPLPAALQEPGRWAAVVSANVLLPGVHAALRPALKPGGLIVFVQPGLRNLERHPKPSARFLAAPGVADRLAAGLELLHHREHWAPDGRFLVELVARRPVRS